MYVTPPPPYPIGVGRLVFLLGLVLGLDHVFICGAVNKFGSCEAMMNSSRVLYDSYEYVWSELASNTYKGDGETFYHENAFEAYLKLKKSFELINSHYRGMGCNLGTS